jgi:propane monooxygenase reductase subunit
MSHLVTLTPSGESFSVDADESVLDAALRQGYALEYGCRHGNCSSCKYFLERGDVDHGEASIYSLSEAEREEGYALLCCAHPVSDLVIAARKPDDPRALPLLTPLTGEATISTLESLTASLVRLVIRPAQTFDFYPGQFAELMAPEVGRWRSYSIASAPGGAELEFIIKRIPGGAFSDALTRLTPGSSLRLRGPFGASYLRAGTRPVLLVAIGSGIAPLLSILDAAVAAGDTRRFEFYYGARSVADLPCATRIATYSAHLGERFSFRPSLTRAEESWDGRRGRVTQVLQRELADGSAYDAYLCGAPAMCDAVGTLLEAKGIRAGQLFYDKFHPAS